MVSNKRTSCIISLPAIESRVAVTYIITSTITRFSYSGRGSARFAPSCLMGIVIYM